MRVKTWIRMDCIHVAFVNIAQTQRYVTIFHDYMAEISDGGVVVAL